MKFPRIKSLREQHGRTQRQTADALGLEKGTYTHYENGKTRIPVRVLIRMSLYYNTSVDYLVGLADDPAPHERGPMT